VELREYQNDLVGELREGYRAGIARQLAVSPTGSGKTVLFAFITKNASEKQQRVFIVAHRREILDQISATLTEVGVKHGFVQAGKSPMNRPVMVCSIQTLARRMDTVEEPDLVIVDEAHHAVSATYIQMFAKWQKARFLGVTATPERLDGSGLGVLFKRMVLGPSVSWLIREGFLAKPVYYAPRVSPPDLSGIGKIGGDYAKGKLEEAFDQPAITGDAVKHYQKLCPGQRAVAFCVSVAHAQHVARRFNDAGIPAAHIDGGMEEDVRRQTVADLKSGKVLVLTSCELISEGFDLPTVNAAILLRPTASPSVHLQQLGRALRMFPGKKEAVILDHAGNCMRHGLAEQDREWSLEGKGKRKEKEKLVEVKTCPQCFAIYGGPQCPQCQHRPEPKAREMDEVAGELQRMTADDFQKMTEAVARRREEGACRTLEDWRKLGRERGHKPGWGWFRFNARKTKVTA
jgi:superfamily II DNA or RNA helicase